MTDTNAMSNSDELAWLEHITAGSDFWNRHAGQMHGVGLQAPPPAPAPVPVPQAEPEPDVSAMSMAEYREYRREHGLDSSDFIGVQPWKYRHISTNEPIN